MSNDGRIEIWDLFKDNLSPLLTYFDKNSDGEVIFIHNKNIEHKRAKDSGEV